VKPSCICGVETSKGKRGEEGKSRGALRAVGVSPFEKELERNRCSCRKLQSNRERMKEATVLVRREAQQGKKKKGF